MMLLIFGFLAGLYVGVSKADKLKPHWPEWLKMKPPHVVKIGGGYAVRKLTPLGYRYLNRSGSLWWGKSDAMDFCLFRNIDDARNHLAKWPVGYGEPVE